MTTVPNQHSFGFIAKRPSRREILAEAEMLLPIIGDDKDFSQHVMCVQEYPHDESLLELLSYRLATIRETIDPAMLPCIENVPPRGTVLTAEPAVCVGRMATGDGLPLPLSRFRCNGAIMGGTGTGKSVLARLIVLQAVLSGLQAVVWDLKDDWRKLADAPLLAGKVIVLRITDLILALLQPPPGVSTRVWVNRFTRVVGNAYGRYSSQRILRQVIDDLLVTCRPGVYPTLRMLIQRLRRYPARSYKERDYVDSVLWPLIDLWKNIGTAVDFTCSTFMERLVDLRGTMVIIEDDLGLPAEHRTFTIAWHLEWLFAYRGSNPAKRVETIIEVIEDASVMTDPQRDRESPGGESPLTQFGNIAREMGIGQWLLVHSASQLSRKLLGNVESVIVCNARGDDILTVQRILGLTRDQAESLRIAPIGVACALIPSVWPKPLAVRYPDIGDFMNG